VAVTVARERLATDGRVKPTGGVAKERTVTDGCVVVRVAAKKRLKTKRLCYGRRCYC